MSIENGVTTGAPKATAQAVAGHGQGKGKAGAQGAGGFAALLQDLGGDTLSAQDGLAAGAESPENQADGRDPSASLAAAPADAGAATIAQPVAAPDGSAALAAALHKAGQPGTALPGAEDAGQAVRPTPVRAEFVRTEQQTAATVPQDGKAEKLVLDTSEQDGRAATGELQPLLRQAAMAQRMAQQRQQSDAAAAQVAKDQRSEDIAARLGWQVSERVGTSMGNAPQIVLAAAAGEAGVRPLERRHEKSDRDVRVGDPLVWSGAMQADGARLDVPAAAPDAGLMTEMRVAEQVSYWAGRGGVQNAELQVDGLGEGPVKVSIALQGQEARVEFRADQVQTRQVLEDSMPHLRELLAREGLVLSGVSVGASGSDGAAGRQQQEGRKGAREATVAVPELQAAARPATRGAALSGRSVDLFV